LAAKKAKLASLDDIEELLSRTDALLKAGKRAQKKKAVCKDCKDPSKTVYYRGRCVKCDETAKNKRIDGNLGKRWFSTNDHEYTYNEKGNVVLYARFRMEQLIGRPLQEHEQVARLDGDKKNNADHNLILVAKPGIDLTNLVCECGRHYLSALVQQQQEQRLKLDIPESLQ
jgi:hypothetical protein